MQYFLKFRTHNHRLPVGRGRWKHTELRVGACDLCLENIGAEYYCFFLNANISLKKGNHLYQSTTSHNLIKFDSLLKSGYLDFSHLIELKNIHITEIYNKKNPLQIINNQES